MPPRRASLPIVLLLLLLPLIPCLGGCNAGPFGGSAHVWDSSGKRVWTGDGSRARLSADFRWNFVISQSTERWKADGGREWNPTQVVLACDRVAPVGFDRLPYQARRPPSYEIAETRTIVCLDPTVVVVAPKPLVVHSLEMDASGYGSANFIKLASAKFQLPRGYQYGSVVDRVDGLQWYSPELSPELRPLSEDGEPRAVALPEGRLVFKPAGKKWRVAWERSG